MVKSELTLLVIDDERAVHREVTQKLAGTVDRVICCADSMESIRVAAREAPDVILLDLNLPKMDGLKVCRHLKENVATREIPVIFLTMDRAVRHLEKALDCGGSDYVIKPVNTIELCARVRAALRTRAMITLLKEQARIDALTGLQNRAALDDALRSAASAHERAGTSYALLMIDIDHFKRINDDFGHGVGDDVLRRIGGAIRSACRPYDTACRYGGDEFSVVFGQVEGSAAQIVANRVLSQIREATVSMSHPIDFGASAGLASTANFRATFEPEEMLGMADAAAYSAKKNGRNRLIVAAAVASCEEERSDPEPKKLAPRRETKKE